MKIKGKKAISLIVLVITILVLSILAATVIISLSNTNIISQANDAVKKTEAQQIEEAKTLMYADGMLGYNPEPQTIGDTVLTWVESDQKVTVVSNKNTEKDGVTIPAGFGYVEGTKDTGLVIEDKDGNQFVWVPVEDYSTFERGTAVETSEGSGVYEMTGDVSDYSEPYISNDWEVKEYNAMCASVEKYGGFYIARFEAGDGDVTEDRTKKTEAHTVVSKKGAIVYDNVSWGKSMTDISLYTEKNIAGAVYLSQNMYKDSTSVVSTLCYGVEWDAVMNFVSDAEHDITYTTSWGNTVSGFDEFTELLQKGIYLRTGSNELWKAKNIYDLAGNASEWTMEVGFDENEKSDGRILRGGYFPLAYRNSGASTREATLAEESNGWVGFRVALYLK